MKVALEQANKRIIETDAKYKKHRRSLELRTKQLHEASKANERLQILVDNLKGELEKAQEKIRDQDEDIEYQRKDRLATLKELHDLRIEFDKEKLSKQKLEIDLQAQNKKSQIEANLLEENLKVQHESEVLTLRERIGDLEMEFEKEFQDHARTKRALEHLRVHFSSLPLTPGGATNMVTQDELTKLDF